MVTAANFDFQLLAESYYLLRHSELAVRLLAAAGPRVQATIVSLLPSSSTGTRQPDCQCSERS